MALVETRSAAHDRLVKGLRAFFRISEAWRLSSVEAMILLGEPGRSSYFQWKKGEVSRSAHSVDLLARLGHVLGIWRELQEIYPTAELADRWIRQPNDAFGGQSALDRMLAGQITDLATVRQYLAASRNGW